MKVGLGVFCHLSFPTFGVFRAKVIFFLVAEIRLLNSTFVLHKIGQNRVFFWYCRTNGVLPNDVVETGILSFTKSVQFVGNFKIIMGLQQ